MSNALVYTTVSVEAQIVDASGVVTDTKTINLNDKITDLKVYDKSGKETTISGMVVSMPIVHAKSENVVPHACYHHEAAIIDGVPLQNKVENKVMFTNDMDDYAIPEIVIKDMTEGSNMYWTVQTNSIISIGEVSQVLYTVGEGGDYADLATAVSSAKAGDILQVTGETATKVTIPVGADITIEGDGVDTTKIAGISCTATGELPTKVTLKNLTLDASLASETYGVTSQNQSSSGQIDLELTLENVVINGFSSKGIYLTNAKKLVLKDCVIEDCAGGEMDEPNTRGDYAVDLNLVAVQDADIHIENCTFTGDCGKKCAIAIKARGGASDAGASDIPHITEATVANVRIEGCTFSNAACEATFSLGSSSKTEGEVVNTTGAYPVTLTSNSAMTVKLAYKEQKGGEAAPIVAVPAGATATKTADGDLEVNTGNTMIGGKGAIDDVVKF